MTEVWFHTNTQLMHLAGNSLHCFGATRTLAASLSNSISLLTVSAQTPPGGGWMSAQKAPMETDASKLRWPACDSCEQPDTVPVLGYII